MINIHKQIIKSFIAYILFLSTLFDVVAAEYKNNCIFYNCMVKNTPKKEMMNASSIPISCDIVSNFIIPYVELQTIGRLGQTCKSYHQCYRDKVVCKIPHCQSIAHACDSYMCRISAQDFDANTDIVAMYAKKYKESNHKDINALRMIHHLWHHHALERLKGVADVLEKPDPSMEDCIQLYAGNYDRSIERSIKIRAKKNILCKKIF